MMRRALIVALALAWAGIGVAHGQAADPSQPTYTFEPSEYQQKDFEFSGYAEGKYEEFDLNRAGAFYQLNKPTGSRPSLNEKGTGTLEVSGKYHKDIVTLNFTAHGDGYRDVVFGNNHETKLYEGGLNLEPATGLSFYAGKKTLLWGKGYAWNPVGFVQRPKDPTDPDLSREGFWMATASYTRSFQDSPVKTLGLMSVFIPTTPAINNDFGRVHHDDAAGKIYALVGNTDIDLMALSGGAKGMRYGADFSSAISPALELHGEVARITESKKTVLNAAGQPTPITSDATSYLLGMNFLAETATTFIVEYYHNGEGFQDSEGDSFYALAHSAYAQFSTTGNTTLLTKAGMMSQMYMKPNPMRHYLNFKVSQTEPFDIVYFTPSLTVQANLTDHSFLILPELLYTGFTNVELRFRVQANIGAHLTEFGEKQASGKAEFRMRYYF
jgi:hypothetical protein